MAVASDAREQLRTLAADAGRLTTLDLPVAEQPRSAAVLILFGVLDQVAATRSGDAPAVSRDLDVLLLSRASTLRSHAGQVAFPGGRVDAEDRDPVDAALREAREETGLDTAGVEVLGTLDAVPLAYSRHLVTPVLGWWRRPSRIRVVDEAESAAVFRVPVADLLDPGARGSTVMRRDGREWAVPLVEAVLEAPLDASALPLLVDLARNAERAFVPEHFALQSAFGARVGARMIDDLFRLRDRAGRRGLSPDAYVELLRAQNRIPDALPARLLRGEARRHPDPVRVARATAALGRLLALLPAQRRTGPLCAWGWLRWADGDTDSAAAAMRCALRQRPGFPLASGLLVLIGRGAPAWARRAGTPLAPRRPDDA